MHNIGERIFFMLNDTDRTKAQLARFLNKSQSTVDGWCNYEKIPSADTIPFIADFLSVTMAWLLTGCEDKHTNVENFLDERSLEFLNRFDALDLNGQAEVVNTLTAQEQRMDNTRASSRKNVS